MKKIVTIFILTFSMLKGADLYVGAGIYSQTQPYIGAENINQLSPVIFYDNSLFYIRWSRAGLYFLGESSDQFSWGASITAQPQIIGYYKERSLTQIGKSSSDMLDGLDDKKSSWEAGLALAGSYEDIFAEVVALQDIGSESNGLKLRAEVGLSYQVNEDLLFVPSVLAIWLSKEFSNYYFSVNDQEVDLSLGRTYYKADAALNLAAQTYMKYSFNSSYHALLNIRADYLDSTIQDSPLVDKHYIFSGLISLIYLYEL